MAKVILLSAACGFGVYFFQDLTNVLGRSGAVPILSRGLVLTNRLSFEGGRYDVNDVVDADSTQTRTRDALIWDVVLTGSEDRYGLEYSFGVYNAFNSRAQSPVSNEFRQRSIPITGRSLFASGTVTF